VLLNSRYLTFMIHVVLVLHFLSINETCTQGNVYHVTVNGDDSNPGTYDKPWRTISYAVKKLRPGDTLIIHGGNYSEIIVLEVSGTKDAPITITSASGEKVILDFQGVHSNCFIFSKGVSHINLENLTLTRCGIWAISLDGGNRFISLRNLDVSDSEVGIHMTIGESGKKPWYGPVGPVTIEGCLIHDNKFVGIDCTPGPCYNLTIRHSNIYNNGISTDFGADGIGVETGDHIIVEWSEIYGNKGDGIDLCSRNPLWFNESSDVKVIGCKIYDNDLEGVKLWTGGRIENTLIYSNGLTGLDFIYNGKYLVINTAIVKNSVRIRSYSVCIGYREVVPLGGQDNLEVEIYNSIIAFNGPSRSPVGIYVGQGVQLISDYNIWYSRKDGEIYFGATGTEYTREDIIKGKWTNDTGNGKHSLAVDPLFLSLERDDYRLQDNSPAIDSANPEKSPNIDLLGTSRPQGVGYDIGPYEHRLETKPSSGKTNQPSTTPSQKQYNNKSQQSHEQPCTQTSNNREKEYTERLPLIYVGIMLSIILSLILLIILLRKKYCT